MKKAFDQTVRDLKRGVNKNVLKVPGIEQKILDATSNEPWGPHGLHLADIAQATRNYHEYQLIMHVIWKRINDTGKNWRHVYKALTVLEYLVGHGSERVIDEIREHTYQISTLSDFQYIDSSGRDQGSNVRRKSQSLVSLVNDKEKIQEVREKATANRDKYRSTHASGGRQSPSSASGGYGDRYDDDRYEGRYRDVDRNGYGRETDRGNKDDNRYGRGGDSYHRDGDRGRDSDERYEKDSYRDDDYRGRGNDDFRPRNKSFDRDRDHSFEADDRYSSRSGGGRVDDSSQDDSLTRRMERKLEQSVDVPPSYEAAVGDVYDSTHDKRDGGNAAAPVTKMLSPPAPKAVSPPITCQGLNYYVSSASVSASNTDPDGFDEFDPRGFAPGQSATHTPTAAPPATSASETNLFGDPSASDLINSLALVPVTTNYEADITTSSDFGTNFVSVSSVPATFSQPNGDPFGDAPFKAAPQGNFQAQQQNFPPATAFHTSSNLVQGSAPSPPAAQKVEAAPSFGFEDTLGGLTFAPTVANGQQHFVANPTPMPTEFTMAQVNNSIQGGFLPMASSGLVPPLVSQQLPPSTNIATTNMNYPLQTGPVAEFAPQTGLPSQISTTSYLSQPGSAQLAQPTQPVKEKFETKSTVWADTMSRGLVNLNISGTKVNPLADIGIDFDSINRMEKRKEKISAAPVMSTIAMGKAMGSGSGIGRGGVGGLAPPANSMVGPGMAMGMGMSGANGMGGMGMGMGMGGYGGSMNQPMGMGMKQGSMRPPIPGPGLPGVGYNPMMGMGGYTSQQPYGGGYR